MLSLLSQEADMKPEKPDDRLLKADQHFWGGSVLVGTEGPNKASELGKALRLCRCFS